MAENAREKLIAAIRDLILQRGYGGTSVDAICESAGVSKGSFFHHFRSKEDAANAALDDWVEMMSNASRRSGYEEEPDPLKRVLLYLDWAAGAADVSEGPKGCLLGTLALELSDTHPDVRQKAAAHFERWASGIAALIQAALGDDDPTRAHGLANHFIASIEGSLLLAKAKQDPSIVRANVDHFRRYLQQLVVRGAHG